MMKTVLLDRDGVINVDSPEYIKSWDEFSFIPGSIEGICSLHRAGFDIFIITNQSAVGRKMITRQTLETMHRNMRSAVASHGGKITDIFYCPHLPEDGCVCRKPAPGMIDAAAAKYGFDPASAVMIGDSAKDIECGIRAGCGWTALVLTGNGEKARQSLMAQGITPNHVAANLLQAVQWILAHSPAGSRR